MDAGYGANTALRRDITALELSYVVGILSTTTVWAPGLEPLRPKAWSAADGLPSSCAAMESISRSRSRPWP